MLHFNPIDYEKLPEIQLYMDQVLGYLDQSLQVFKESEEDVILTKTMINNYVKAGLIGKPEKKKYDQNHLADLIMIYFLKNTVSMQTIEGLKDLDKSVQERYTQFNAIQSGVLNETESLLTERQRDHELALELLIRADVYKRVAKQIVKEL